VQDRGGGIPRSAFDKIFSYTYTTAPKPSRNDSSPMVAVSAGLGYGLPLSRLYAWYFHGDLFLVPIDGYGTDACIYLKALAVDANELLPYFSVTTRKFYSSGDQCPGWVHSRGLQQTYDCSSALSLSQSLY
ncbi:unnamed protein product, partial [Soboliphyme baturini]|uniref:Protein-serine/threonine kinase n=1 Tax=Soboliphyme baturini TaxID=241478 RepID=A0A183J6W4_9BILA